MNLDDVRKQWRADILRLAERHGARNVRVFGSVARGEETDASDLDLLVEMEPGRNYFDLVAFWQDLEETLGAPIDVITDGGVSPYLSERIYGEAVQL
jgi:predicted nucleotidyltransferase